MSDPIPDHSNLLAYWLGRLFHPAVLSIPTLALILNDQPLMEALRWTVLVATLVTVPGLIAIALLHRRQRYVYQRHVRGAVYLILWLSVIVCLGVVWGWQGPAALRVCLAALIVWLPLQLAINTYITKVSTHVAVAAGCATGLLLLGKLDSLPLQLTALTIVGLIIWARVTTRNHTVAQVLLGLMVGIGSVLVVFPLLLT
jgi:hypothetical protein